MVDRCIIWQSIVLNVSALTVTKGAEQVTAIKTTLDGVFGHSLGLFEVDVAGDLLKFAEVLHVFDQLIVGAVEAGVDIDLILVHKERSLKCRSCISLLSLDVVNFEIVDSKELPIGLFLQTNQFIFHILVIFGEVGIIILSLVHEVRKLTFEIFVSLG